MHRAVLAHASQITFETCDPLLNAAPINFELCLARTARSNSSRLTRQVGPHPGKTRKKILQLSELNLKTAFPGPRATGENIEDELRAVQDLSTRQLLEIASLCRRKLVIEDQRRHVLFPALAGNLFSFPFADVKRRRRLFQLLDDCVDNLGTGGGGELT